MSMHSCSDEKGLFDANDNGWTSAYAASQPISLVKKGSQVSNKTWDKNGQRAPRPGEQPWNAGRRRYRQVESARVGLQCHKSAPRSGGRKRGVQRRARKRALHELGTTVLQETGRRKQQQQQQQKQKRGSAADQYKKRNIRGLTGESAEKGPQRLVLGR